MNVAHPLGQCTHHFFVCLELRQLVVVLRWCKRTREIIIILNQLYACTCMAAYLKDAPHTHTHLKDAPAPLRHRLSDSPPVRVRVSVRVSVRVRVSSEGLGLALRLG